MNAPRPTLRVLFAPGVHITRGAKDAIAKRLGGARVRRHLWADFITVARCRGSLISAAGALWGWPNVVAIEDDHERVALVEDWPAVIARADTLSKLAELVPQLRRLPEEDREVLRPLWSSRRAQLWDLEVQIEERQVLELA